MTKMAQGQAIEIIGFKGKVLGLGRKESQKEIAECMISYEFIILTRTRKKENQTKMYIVDFPFIQVCKVSMKYLLVHE